MIIKSVIISKMKQSSGSLDLLHKIAHVIEPLAYNSSKFTYGTNLPSFPMRFCDT